MSKLLIALLALAISHEALAFGKKAVAPAPAHATAPVASPAAQAQVAPAVKAPAAPPVTYDESFEFQGADEVKPAAKPLKKPVIKPAPAPKIATPMPVVKVPPVLTLEKQQEIAALDFAKHRLICGKSADGIDSTGTAQSVYAFKEYYGSYEEFPPSLKKVVDKKIEQCDRDRHVGAYYKAPTSVQTSKTTPTPVAVAAPTAEDQINDSAKKVGDFFGKLGHDITVNGAKEKTCSHGETQMHANGC